MTLFQSKVFQNAPSKNFHSVVKVLSDMKKKWVDTQKQLQATEILLKTERTKPIQVHPKMFPALKNLGWTSNKHL